MTNQRSWRKAAGYALALTALLALFLSLTQLAWASPPAQIPTVSVPTVTSSPALAVVTVTREYDQVNLRSGPGAEYPIVGVLIAGSEVPGLGRSAGGLWVQIVYPGGPGGVAWIYAPLLVEIAGSLPILEPPPTPTPQTTPTVDPTLAAQFIVEIPPTRLPTFTPPPPLAIPTFAPEEPFTGTGRVPMGLLIVGMGIVGVFGLILSLLRGR
ncbi:MAG: SH3 domain-containing protein [Chloroflexi bacterium]|nr:SH3 domain-containing protein [Chloroflexota bacterium]